MDVFVLEESIGVGGMGAVFRATDTRLDRFVALKILPPDQAVDPEVVLRYHQEGRAAARLDHENIARVYTIGDNGTYHYIAFEYIEGTTIRQRVERDGVLGVAQAIDFTLQIANALVHAVERDVVHRDIKPSNIIVTPQGRAKLVDMGLARRFERGEDTGLTQSGMTLGTFDYISPEQARDPRTVDVRGDLYSLGCTLFHMLSGRPPFPEGTVLQKLLQHQEEPPPDIRKLNPNVPAELASVLVKLMAKDRDRRYQSPEQLVRDLLAVAGSVGLRPDLADGLAWKRKRTGKLAPSWARHVFWGVPVAVFVVIVGVMAWWGEGSSAPSTSASSAESPAPIINVAKPRDRPAPPRVEPTPEAPRQVVVGPDDDLLRELLEAPPRSTILLSDEGPYDLRGVKAARLVGLDLTIKAELGVRPVIRLPKGRAATDPGPLVEIIGGRITLDGLEFVTEQAGVAIRTEEAELLVRRCTFRRSGTAPARSKPAAIVARTSAIRALDRDPMVTIEASDFDGGQAGVIATGPVGISIRECTFGPSPAELALFWADNTEATQPVPVDLRVSHISVLTGPGPVFRFNGTTARVVVRASAFGPTGAGSPTSTLVAVDVPDRLEWRGVDNLYARIGTYLRPSGLRLPVRSYDAWADDPATYREAGSITLDAHPWEERQPLDSLLEAATAQEPARAFRLAIPRSIVARPGARQGPYGPLPPPTMLATVEPAKPPKEVAVVTPPPRQPKVDGGDDEMKQMPLTLPTKPKGVLDPRVNDEPGVAANDLVNMPMPPDPERPAPPTVAPVSPPKVIAIDAEVIRTPRQFLEALDRPKAGVKTLLIAADADLILPSSVVRGGSSWIIRAEKGLTRPRIRFRPDLAAVPAAGWVAWLTLPSGSLRLEGLDLLISSSEATRLPDRSWAAFAVRSGTADLSLTDCTVTIEGNAARSAVIAVVPVDLADAPVPLVDPAAPASRRVSIKDSLIRAGGDLVDVAAGCPVDLDLDDVAVATGGTLVHGHGQPKGQAAEPIKVALRQVTARVAGGLARLESSPGKPEPPVADFVARDTILATDNAETPLFQVDGQGDLDQLRDRIHWEGRSVAYHQIEVYRRDQTSQLGAVPNSFGLESWKVAVGRREEDPIHGDQKFLEDWDSNRPPWTLRSEDIRLRPESPAAVAGIGSDLLRIPNPPAAVARP